jgi:hypothetical protein
MLKFVTFLTAAFFTAFLLPIPGMVPFVIGTLIVVAIGLVIAQ